jgi:16S rRNA (guanine(1405)-N(7))-methyltransferase
MMTDDLSKLLEAVLKSPKYRHVHPGFIERIGAVELAKGVKLQAAVKATKNKLHQVGGAYFTTKIKYDFWYQALIESTKEPLSLKAICREILSLHTSTQERLAILDEFYEMIFSELPKVKSILDLACGLNPLTIPWMPLDKSTSYYACDIYRDMVAFLNSCLPIFEVKGRAKVCDVIAAPPNQPVDLALILKSLPCLEQVDSNTGIRLIDAINAKHIVVSYPVASLGGEGKGMVKNYEDSFRRLVDGRGWEAKKYLFKSELAFLISRK